LKNLLLTHKELTMPNSQKPLRWGLISTANINRRVIPAIHEARRGELAAIASRTREKAEAYAKKWEIPLAFGSYQEMLDSGKVDVVYISLPNHLHAKWSIKALQAGIHVLCEKPFALSLEQVDAMITASQETGMVLAEAFMYRHHPQTKLAGEMVRAGKLGEVTLVRGTFDFSFSSRDNIRLVPEFGGGCLWDVGVYPLSFSQYILGSAPDWVMGAQWVGSSGVDEVFVGQMGYRGGRFAQISAAFRTPFYTYAEVIGTQGRLYLDRPFVGINQGTMRVFPAQGEVEVIPPPEKPLYLGEIEDMHSAILDSEPNYLSLEESRNHVRTVLGLYESAKNKQVVTTADN
jgi:predicted dehydrogenase